MKDSSQRGNIIRGVLAIMDDLSEHELTAVLDGIRRRGLEQFQNILLLALEGASVQFRSMFLANARELWPESVQDPEPPSSVFVEFGPFITAVPDELRACILRELEYLMRQCITGPSTLTGWARLAPYLVEAVRNGRDGLTLEELRDPDDRYHEGRVRRSLEIIREKFALYYQDHGVRGNLKVQITTEGQIQYALRKVLTDATMEE